MSCLWNNCWIKHLTSKRDKISLFPSGGYQGEDDGALNRSVKTLQKNYRHSTMVTYHANCVQLQISCTWFFSMAVETSEGVIICGPHYGVAVREALHQAYCKGKWEGWRSPKRWSHGHIYISVATSSMYWYMYSYILSNLDIWYLWDTYLKISGRTLIMAICDEVLSVGLYNCQ